MGAGMLQGKNQVYGTVNVENDLENVRSSLNF